MKSKVSPCALKYDLQVEAPLLPQQSVLQIQDTSAIPFVQTQALHRSLDHLLLPAAFPAVRVPFFYFEAVEKAAMREDMLLPQSCPVNLNDCELVDSLFSADSQTPNHPVLETCNKLKLTVHPLPVLAPAVLLRFVPRGGTCVNLIQIL